MEEAPYVRQSLRSHSRLSSPEQEQATQPPFAFARPGGFTHPKPDRLKITRVTRLRCAAPLHNESFKPTPLRDVVVTSSPPSAPASATLPQRRGLIQALGRSRERFSAQSICVIGNFSRTVRPCAAPATLAQHPTQSSVFGHSIARTPAAQARSHHSSHLRATDYGPAKAPALRCGRGLFARNHRPHYTRLRIAGNSSLAAA